MLGFSGEDYPAFVEKTVVLTGGSAIGLGLILELYGLFSSRGSSAFTVNTLAAVVGATTCFALGAIALLTKGSSLFVWHPILMSAGVLFLATGAIDLLKRKRAMASAGPRKKMVQLHWFMMDAAYISMGMGLWAIYANKSKPLAQHFVSAHSMIGLAALGLFGLNLCGGAAKTLLPMLSGRSMSLLWTDALHRYGGFLAYTFLVAAVVSGLYNRVVLLPDGWGGKFEIPGVRRADLHSRGLACGAETDQKGLIGGDKSYASYIDVRIALVMENQYIATNTSFLNGLSGPICIAPARCKRRSKN
eukprot:jgi/Bigna1/84031/fgenesh1_pg.120_\